MAAQQLANFHFNSVDEGNYHARNWLVKCMTHARPAPYLDGTLGPSDGIPDYTENELNQQLVGFWSVKNKNWRTCFKALLALPTNQPVQGQKAVRDLNEISPGIGLRWIRLIREGYTKRELAIFIQPGRFHLFSPKSGLWEVEVDDPLDWFASHMDATYGPLFEQATFEANCILPHVDVAWVSGSDLQKARYRKAAHQVATALEKGHVSLSEAHGSSWAYHVLLELLKKHPDQINSIFLEASNSISYVSPGKRSALLKAKGLSDDLANELAVRSRTTDTKMYAFDPINSQPNGANATMHVPSWPGATSTTTTVNTVSSTGTTSTRDRIQNMAGLFMKFASKDGKGSLTINDIDHLFPTYGGTGTALHPGECLPMLSGIQQVYDFSGKDRSSQQPARGFRLYKEHLTEGVVVLQPGKTRPIIGGVHDIELSVQRGTQSPPGGIQPAADIELNGESWESVTITPGSRKFVHKSRLITSVKNTGNVPLSIDIG